MVETIRDYVFKIKVGTVAVAMITLVSILFGAGVCYEKIQARLRHLDGKTDIYAERFDDLQKRVNENDVKFAEIQKDLASIESILLELKNKLK